MSDQLSRAAEAAAQSLADEVVEKANKIHTTHTERRLILARTAELLSKFIEK